MITGDQSATAFAIARKLDLNNGGDLKVLEAGQIAGLDAEGARRARRPAAGLRAREPGRQAQYRQGAASQWPHRGDDRRRHQRRAGACAQPMSASPWAAPAPMSRARSPTSCSLATISSGIVEAIRLGRATYANIRKVLRYLVSTNASETLTMLGAALVGGGAAR